MKTPCKQSAVRRRLSSAALISLTAIAGLTARADYSSAVLNDAPLAYYPLNLDVDTGTSAADLTASANNGAYVNITSGNKVTGPSQFITNAVSFDGTSAYVDLGVGANATLLDFGGQITMEAWVRPASSSVFGDILAKGYDSSNNNYELTLRVNGPYGANYYSGTYGPAGTQGATGGQQTTSWTHVVSVYDGANWRLYVNGQQVAQGGDSVGAINFPAPWRIGTGSADGATRFFQGDICQVAIYNYGLSSDQVFSHYFAGQYGVTPAEARPFINTQPEPQAVYAGGAVQFSVGALSYLPSTNQWYRNGSPLAGQTNTYLNIFNAQAGDAGNYSVVIGNANGTTNSASAALSLLTPPSPAVASSLVWTAPNTGVWDAGASSNWKNLANNMTTMFGANDAVLFDDTPGVPTTVSINADVSPSYITNNSSANNFTFSGANKITGQASLTKLGTSTLTLGASNDFTGTLNVWGGTVQLQEPLSGSLTSFGSLSGAPVNVANGATLAVNASGPYPAGNGGIGDGKQIFINGSGAGGAGALRSIGNDVYHDSGGLFRSLTMTGDATIGGTTRWDLGTYGKFTYIGTDGHNYNLTVVEKGYAEWHEVTFGPNVGDIDLIMNDGNSINWYGMGASLGNPTNVLTVHSGLNLSLWHQAAGGDNGYAKIVHLMPNAQFSYRPAGGPGDYHIDTSLVMDEGASWNFYNGDGGNGTGVEVGGKIVLNGLTHLSTGNSPLSFTNVISGPGGFVWQTYDSTVYFTADNTYAGPTVIGDGRTLALSGNGAISHSSLIFFGGSGAFSMRLDASGRADSTLTLASGQTLGGIGLVNGSLNVSSGATIAPSGTNTTLGVTSGANAVGTIAANGDVFMHGTTVIKLNGNGMNDAIQSFANGITYGGALQLVNVSGVPMNVGDSFQVFIGSVNTGSFSSVSPASPGSGLAWDLSDLATGIIRVKAGAVTPPSITMTKVSGGNLIISGTGGAAGSSFSVLTAQDVNTPLTDWTPVSTNMFDSNGAFSVTNAITQGVPRRFYIIKLQ